jgi:hypothetical protein
MRDMSNTTFMTENGKFHFIEDIGAIVDYYERTGDYPDHFSESDINRFYDRYVIPYREGVSDDRNNNI